MKKPLLVTFAMFLSIALFSQECSDLFISEYIEGSGNNKAIELYNPTVNPIDMVDYKLVRYSNGGTTPYNVNLAGIIQPKSTFVFVLDKRDPDGVDLEQPVDSALAIKADTFLCPVYEVNRMMYFNGNDAVTLEKISNGSIVDIIGLVGPPMTSDDNGWGSLNDTTITYNSGGNPTEYTISNYIVGPLFWLSWTKDNTLIRKSEISEGVKANPSPYFVVTEQWDSIPKNTFDSLGFHTCYCNTLSIDESSIKSNIGVYPNPVINSEFTIEADEPIQEIKIVDLSGKIVEFIEVEARVETLKLSVDSNLSGFYFVQVKLQTGEVQTLKILLK